MPDMLVDAAARSRISTDLDDTLFVEAGAGAGKTTALVDRVLALVESGIPMRRIAAITFTEKAAAELRDRIRLELEGRRRAAPGDGAATIMTALHELDGAAVSTLHAFAQRLLSHYPVEAGLPPRLTVLDEVSSQLQFQERWRRFRENLLEDPSARRVLHLADALKLGLDEDIRDIARAFGDNWDLVAEPERIPGAWNREPVVDFAAVRASIAYFLAPRPRGEDTLTPWQERARDLDAALAGADEQSAVSRLLQFDTSKRPAGRQAVWDDKEDVRQRLFDMNAAIDAVRARLSADVLHHLGARLRDFTLDAAGERRASGELEFHDLLVLARELLRGPHGRLVRRGLAGRYERLLLDEFQDTDPIQIELAVMLGLDDPDVPGEGWDTATTAPGRLFFVGDPKQSIYRFRRADIAMFLDARDRFGGEDVVRLHTNFRSAPAIVAWVNHVFATLITPSPGSQPEYQPLSPAPDRRDPDTGPAVAVVGVEAHQANLGPVRGAEAAEIVATVLGAVQDGWAVRDAQATGGWRACRLGDIALLLPSRTTLPYLEQALEDAHVPFRAEASSLVYSTREVRDVLLTARAVADPSDELSLVAALRSPVFGCGDDDLARWVLGSRGHLSLVRRMPEGADPGDPVVESLVWLRSLATDVPFLTAAEVLDRIVRERRVLEVAHAHRRPRDVWRRIRFVIDQARAWDQAEQGTLREYVEWARLQASENARVSEAILPETDDDAVRILTVHAAKGLEFPIVVLSGLGSQPWGSQYGLRVEWPPDGPVALKVRSDLRTPEFDTFAPIDETLGYHERIRLLYVACTRAQDHLVVSLHRKSVSSPPNDERRPSADLIHDACQGGHHLVLEPDVAARHDAARLVPPDDLPDVTTWRAETAAMLERARRPRSVGASGVTRLPDPEEDEGLHKEPRDLELPPWLRGRYGSAIGRAVHGVLQTVTLPGPDDAELAGAVAAQAVAESVVDQHEDVERLVRFALTSNIMREAAGGEYWREIYVGTQIGGTILEGYVDLVFRTADGLTLVDHKTASSARDLDDRIAAYRLQQAAYALALEQATGLPVTRAVLLFLTPSGAIEHDVPDLDDAKESVQRRLVSAG